MSPGWFVMMIGFFAIMSVFCNIVSEATQPVSADDIDTMKNLTATGEVTSTSGEGGSVLSFINIAGTTLQYFIRSLMADYAFFYTYDPVTGIRKANDFMWIRYVFFWPLSAGFIICVALSFRYFLSR